MKKTVITVRNKQCNVCSHMIYLQFAFKDPKYARNILFCLYSEILKKLNGCFSHTKNMSKV